MAAVNPPWACQGRTDHPAALFRMMLAGEASSPVANASTAPGGGVNPVFGNAMQITGLASLNVQVGTGLVYMPNTTAWNGMYAGYNTATFNLALAAVSATQWRTDRVDAVVVDPGDNTANWNVVVTTGTFSSSAPGSTPAAPANSTPLALVRVVPNMTVTNGGGTIVDSRLYQPLSGPWPTTSSARPPLTAPNGTMWYETDTNLLGVIVNGAYQYIAFSSVVDSWHNITLDSGWAAGAITPRYRLWNGVLQLSGQATRSGIAGSANVNNVNPLPAGYRPPGTVDFGAYYDTNFNRAHMSMNNAGVITASSSGTVVGTWFAELNAIIPVT